MTQSDNDTQFNDDSQPDNDMHFNDDHNPIMTHLLTATHRLTMTLVNSHISLNTHRFSAR